MGHVYTTHTTTLNDWQWILLTFTTGTHGRTHHQGRAHTSTAQTLHVLCRHKKNLFFLIEVFDKLK